MMRVLISLNMLCETTSKQTQFKSNELNFKQIETDKPPPISIIHPLLDRV